MSVDTTPDGVNQFNPPVPPPTPVQPTAAVTPTPPVQASATPQGTQPTTQPPVAQPPVSQHARLFDKILGTMSPPVQYTDNNGVRQTVPQSRGSLGRAVIASVLAGMFSGGDTTSPGAGGVPRNDPGKALTQGFQAGQQNIAQRSENAQKLYDDMQARKLMTTQNNVNLLKLMAASSHEQHVALQELNDNAQTFLSPFEEYEKTRTADQPSAFLQRGLTAEQVTAPNSGIKLTDSNVVMDGTQMVFNPVTKQEEEHPLYSVLNPALDKVSLPPEVASKLAEINSQYKDIHAITGGSVRVPVNAYVNAMHDYQTVTQAQSTLNTLNQELNGDTATSIDLAPVIRANRALMPALNLLISAGAAGNTVDNRPDNLLHTLLQAPNGGQILNLLGLTPAQADQKIQDIGNERIRKAALAKEGGIGDKAPMDPAKVAALPKLATDLGLSPAQTDIAIGKLNPNGTTVGEYNKIVDKVQAQSNANRTFAAANPNPAASQVPPSNFAPNPNASQMEPTDLQKDLQTKGVRVPANFATLYAIAHNSSPLTTLPPNPRKGSNQMSAQEGLTFIRQYINPQYQEGDYAAASGLSKELASTRQGTAGGSLLSAGVASNHLELLDQAATALNNNDTQALNRVANALGIQFGKSPAVTFQAIADQVNAEVGKVVAGGTPHEAELDKLRQNLNSDQSPEQVRNVIRSYIGLMDGRVGEINDRSQQYFGRDVRGISPTAAKVFAKYGFDVPGYTRVQVNGATGAIPKVQIDAFRKKYPAAVIGGQ